MKLVEMVWIVMANQKFSAAEREATWLAHEKKCAYTRELIDVSSFHIDHIVPEISRMIRRNSRRPS
jgi:hypothetical protein